MRRRRSRRGSGPIPPPHPSVGRPQRVEHDYDRGGALCYLAAWDVHRGQLTGRCEQQTGIVPFGRLIEQVMTREPYRNAKRVLWIVDNGSSQRGQASIDRLQTEWPNLSRAPTRRSSASDDISGESGSGDQSTTTWLSFVPQ